jgi:hypothetical protein
MLGRMLRSWCTLHRPAILGCLWMAGLLGALTWLDFRDGGIFLIPPFAATLTILVYQPECLNRPTHRSGVRLAPWRGDRHRTQHAPWLRSRRSVAGVARCDDHAALAARLSSARSRSGDVSCSVALRSMVCDSGRATICACRGGLLRGAEPLGQQLATIPRPFLVRVSGSLNRSPVPSRLLWSSEIGGFNPRSTSGYQSHGVGILTTIFAPQRCSR